MRLALIPVGGTIAALLAILATRAPREESPYPLPRRRATPDQGSGFEPLAPRSRLRVRLLAGGAFEEPVTGRRFADAEELMKALAPPGGPRPIIEVSKASAEVTEKALDEALAKLRERCDARKAGGGGPDDRR